MTTNNVISITTPQNFTYLNPERIKQTDIRKNVEARIAEIDRQWAALPHSLEDTAKTDAVIGMAIGVYNDIDLALRSAPDFEFPDVFSIRFDTAKNKEAARSAAWRALRRVDELVAAGRISDACVVARSVKMALTEAQRENLQPLRELVQEIQEGRR